MLKIKRIYEPPVPEDGKRYLVDRLWPRGISKSRAGLDDWLKDVAPSQELRRWFDHDPAKWEAFQERYRAELRQGAAGEIVEKLGREALQGTVTLLYAAKDATLNNAVCLKQLIENTQPAARDSAGRLVPASP